MSDRPPAAGGTTEPADTSGASPTPPPSWDRPPDAPWNGPDAYPPGPDAAGAYPPGPYAGGAYPPGPYPPGPDAAGPYAGGAYPSGPYPPGAEGGGYPAYGVPAPRPRLWPPSRTEWRVALALLLGLVVVGAALAPLWVQLAPRLAFRVDQPGRALPVVPEAEEYIAGDGRFVLLTLAAGVLAGLVCWFARSSRGPLLLVVLAAGGLLGAVVTWRLGLRLGTGYRPEDLQVVGTTVHQPLTLRARAGLVVEPVAAVVVYLLAAGFSSRNDLGRDEEREPVSSGSG